MPREIWNEGRVVGLSAYELYVKQHLSEDPDTPVATEREWLASSLGMGSSMILKMPNVNQDSTSYQEYYVDIPLPADSRLAAANSIVATFFEGEVEMQDTYWAKKVTSYGPLITNALVNNEDPEYQLKLNPISDLGYTIPDYKTTSNLRYIYLGGCIGTNSVPKYEVSSEVDVSTGVARLVDPEIIELTLGVDLSGKYIKLYDQIGQIEPNPIFKQGYIIKVPDSTDETKDLFVYTQWLCIRCEQLQYVTVKTLEGTHPALEGYVSTTEDVLPDSNDFYVENRTNGHSPGTAMNDWQKTTRAQLSDYLKIMDGIVIQPGTWTETETPPPTSDFEVDLKNRPRIRLRVHGQITTNPLILLTGFTVRYVLCGTLGQDTALDTQSYADGDFLGPAIFPWCNKILFTVPNSYIDFFERDYLNTSIYPTSYSVADKSIETTSTDWTILGNKPVVYFLQNKYDTYDYFHSDVVTDENLFIQGGKRSDDESGEFTYRNRKELYDETRLQIKDYASLNDKQSVFLIYSRNSKFPPSLYSGTITDTFETGLFPVDVSSPGTVKMFHETSYNETKVPYGKRKDAPYEISSEYEASYPGTNAIVKKYDDGTLWTIDNRKVASTDTYDDSTIPVSKVDNYNMNGYAPRPAGGTIVDGIYDPKSEETDEYPKGTPIQYKVVSAGRDSISILPAGESQDETEEQGVRDSYYLMSTKHSPILEEGDHSDEDFINWYDLIRALAGNRKIDILGPGLRNFKHSLEDGNNGDRVLNVYKATITPNKSSGHSPGPGDRFGNGSSSLQNINIFDKIKLDVMGYSQRYDDGKVGKGEISTRTNNFISTLSLFTDTSGKFQFTEDGFSYKDVTNIQSVRGLSGTDYHGSTVNISASSDATLTAKEIKVGVNAWVQRIQIRNSTTLYNILKLLRQMYLRVYYNCTINIVNPTQSDTYEINSINPETQGVTRGGTLSFDYDSGDIKIKWNTPGDKDTFIRTGGGKGKPGIGYSEYYAHGDPAIGGGSIIMLSISRIGKASYKILVSWGKLNYGSHQSKSLVFTGSVPVFNATDRSYNLSEIGNSKYYMSPGQIIMVIDVKTVLGAGNAASWMPVLDEVTDPELDFTTVPNSQGLFGYIYGKGAADANWFSIGNTVVSGSLVLSEVSITDSDYISKGGTMILGELCKLGE